ncbi:hypothetical protein MNBD_ALPHA06-994 [hydrothermal vent metagenome]|uniref:Lipopolysaccharide export system protein LptC n=1 Tax=hydrothermal vent metagenome TaxID=652676 RepID=A0A3B0RUF7_9ZZZZ
MNMSMELTSPAHGQINWAPERHMTLHAARRRSILVKLLRFIFISAALAIVGIVAMYIVINARQPEPVIVSTPVISPEIKQGEQQMNDALFTGHDGSRRPYEVRAETAVRLPEGAAEVTKLVNPTMVTDPTKADSSKVKAEQGTYDATNQTLNLSGNVRLGTNNGYTYTTEQADIIIGEDRIVGNKPVTGIGPMGTINAQSYEIENGGEVLKFKGRVKTRISFGKDKEEKKNEE